METWLVMLLMSVAAFMLFILLPIWLVARRLLGRAWRRAFVCSVFVACWWHVIPGYLYFRHLCQTASGIEVVGTLARTPQGYDLSKLSERSRLGQDILHERIYGFKFDFSKSKVFFGAVHTHEITLNYNNKTLSRSKDFGFYPIELDSNGPLSTLSLFNTTDAKFCVEMRGISLASMVSSQSVSEIFPAPD